MSVLTGLTLHQSRVRDDLKTFSDQSDIYLNQLSTIKPQFSFQILYFSDLLAGTSVKMQQRSVSIVIIIPGKHSLNRKMQRLYQNRRIHFIIVVMVIHKETALDSEKLLLFVI